MNIEAGRESLGSQLPDVYYVSEARKPYARPLVDGRYVSENEQGVRRYLKELGYAAGNPLAGHFQNEISEILLRIHNENSVHSFGNIGWLDPGTHLLEGKRILVSNPLNKIAPEKGNWKVVQNVIEGLVTRDVQYDLVLSWLSLAVKGYYSGRHQYGQSLILVGDPSDGKSFFQNWIITPVLGGKSENPYQWLLRPSSYNGNLFGAIHLLVEDEFSGGTKKDRQHLSGALKRISASGRHIFREKYVPAFSLDTYWRISISLNKDPNCLSALPELSQDVLGKMIICLCHPIDFKAMGSRFDAEGNNLWEQTVMSEMPAFIYYLLYEHHIPGAIADPRYGVASYISPEVQKLADLYSIDSAILSILATLYAGMRIVKTSTEVLLDLENSGYRYTVSKYISINETLAMFLGALAKKRPEHCQFLGLEKGEGKWVLDFTGRSFAEEI